MGNELTTSVSSHDARLTKRPFYDPVSLKMSSTEVMELIFVTIL